MKRRMLFMVMAVTITLSITGCGDGGIQVQSQTPMAATNTMRNASDFDFWIWTDQETGVQYIVYKDGYGGGITPRINLDGSLYTGHLEVKEPGNVAGRPGEQEETAESAEVDENAKNPN